MNIHYTGNVSFSFKYLLVTPKCILWQKVWSAQFIKTLFAMGQVFKKFKQSE